MSATVSNGREVHSEEPIMHEYDAVGHIVMAECVCCCTNTRRRVLERDYELETDFQQPLDDSEFWLPTTIYRDCDECGHETTHFVC